jgi:hypothetical protein
MRWTPTIFLSRVGAVGLSAPASMSANPLTVGVALALSVAFGTAAVLHVWLNKGLLAAPAEQVLPGSVEAGLRPRLFLLRGAS